MQTAEAAIATSAARPQHWRLLGTYVLFAVLCGSSSCIAMPAIQRLAFPEASPTLPLAASLTDPGSLHAHTPASPGSSTPGTVPDPAQYLEKSRRRKIAPHLTA